MPSVKLVGQETTEERAAVPSTLVDVVENAGVKRRKARRRRRAYFGVILKLLGIHSPRGSGLYWVVLEAFVEEVVHEK
jgi:hypothetical protein